MHWFGAPWEWAILAIQGAAASTVFFLLEALPGRLADAALSYTPASASGDTVRGRPWIPAWLPSTRSSPSFVTLPGRGPRVSPTQQPRMNETATSQELGRGNAPSAILFQREFCLDFFS